MKTQLAKNEIKYENKLPFELKLKMHKSVQYIYSIYIY